MSKYLLARDSDRSDSSLQKNHYNDNHFDHTISEKYDKFIYGNRNSKKQSLSPSPSERISKTNEINSLFRCGTFIPKTGSKAYKTQKMKYTAFFSPQSMYTAMCKRKIKKFRSQNTEYSQLRQTYVEWIFDLAGKFKISNGSSQLAVNLMDSLFFSTISHNGKLQLYAPASLLLAAKTIELDERIPFISKLRRMANSAFSVDDYKKAELALLENVDWNPQFTSILEFVEFFLCQGVVYSSDSYFEEDEKEALKENTHFLNKQNHKSNRKTETSGTKNHEDRFGKEEETSAKLCSLSESRIIEIVSKLESSASKLCNLVVKSIEVVESDNLVLACACIGYLREIHGISPCWPDELHELTGVAENSIQKLLDQYHKFFDTDMVPDRPLYSPKTPKQLQTKPSSSNKEFYSPLDYNPVYRPYSGSKQGFGSQSKDHNYALSQPSSLTSLDSSHSEYTADLKNELSKNERAKIHANPKSLAPASYNELTEPTAIHQSGRHKTVGYGVDYERNRNYYKDQNFISKQDIPILTRGHSSTYENSYSTNNSSYISSHSNDLYAKQGESHWKNPAGILSARSSNIDSAYYLNRDSSKY